MAMEVMEKVKLEHQEVAEVVDTEEDQAPMIGVLKTAQAIKQLHIADHLIFRVIQAAQHIPK